jgi:hypothetical protein
MNHSSGNVGSDVRYDTYINKFPLSIFPSSTLINFVVLSPCIRLLATCYCVSYSKTTGQIIMFKLCAIKQLVPVTNFFLLKFVSSLYFYCLYINM